MSNTMRLTIPQAGDIMRVAPRQVWLASLGAVAVAREWAETEAGSVFRTLVNEGTAAETKAIHRIGERVNTSLKHARRLVDNTRNTATMALASIANTASTFVRAKLPAMRARSAVESTATPRKRVAKSVKRAPKAVKRNTASRRGTAR